MAYKYTSEDETGEGGVMVETGFDTAQFGDIELFGTIMQFKGTKKSFWQSIEVGGSIVAKPVFYKNNVYFGACDKNFYCLDKKSGEEVWRLPTNGMIHDESGADFRGDVVYFCCCDGNLYAVNADTGILVWKFATAGIMYGDPRVDGGSIYFSSGDGNIYSVNAKNGHLKWKLNVNVNTLVPAPHGNNIYAGYLDNRFFCVSKEGKIKWIFYANGMIAAWPPAFSENCIYFGSWDNNLYCINYNGEVVWKFKAGDVAYTPILHEGKLYFGSRDFCIYCLNASNGSPVWKYKTGGFVINAAVHNGRLYFGSYDNNIYCLDAGKGKVIWRFPTNGFVNAVSVDGGRVYAGSWDCNLYCLDADTGRLLWRFKTSIATPSPITPPETSTAKTAEIIWTAETEEEKRKYKGEGGAGYEVNISQYGVMDKGYMGHSKKGYKT